MSDPIAEAKAVLYALKPAEFTAARNARASAAKAAGDKVLAGAIAKLGKPTVAAYAVNLLVRAKRDEIEQLLALGDALRQAQVALDPDDLRTFSAQRSRVVGALARSAREVVREAGGTLPEGAVSDIEETLRAAVADPSAADAVRGGALTTTLSYAGLGELPMPGAPRPERQRKPAKAEAADPAAKQRKREAEQRLAAAEKRRSSLQREVRDNATAVERLTEQLGQAQNVLRVSQEALQSAEADLTARRKAAAAE